MKKQTSPPNRRGRLVLLCFVLGLILIVMLVGTVYLQHLLGRIHYVDSGTAPTLSPEELDAYLATQPEEINTAPTMDPEDVTFPDYDADIGRDSDIINILLIGQDRREDETRARSDSMILCTFHKSEKKLTMTSFLRDTYVKIPGYGQNRINVAYAAGGMSLLNKTLENNFGIHIDGNVEVDFYQFADIVDLLGGVEVDLRNDEAQWVNRETGSSLSEGTNLLNGQQALAYARIRKLDADGDFSRTNRQRKVITALLDAYRVRRQLPADAPMNGRLFFDAANAGEPEALEVLEQVLPLITTDMTDREILGYAVSLFPLMTGGEVVSQHIPAAGTYASRNIDGMAVLVADLEANRQVLKGTLGG